MHDPVYISRVGRFVRFLEDRGDIPVADDVEDISRYLSLYADRLVSLGFSRWQRRIHFSAAEHFAAWLRVSRVQWCDVDDAVIERFARHDCRCALWRKKGKLAETGVKKRRRGAHRLLAFLNETGIVASASTVADPIEAPRLAAFRVWLERHCGATDKTIDRYISEALRWLPELGADPAAYDAIGIRNVVLSQPPSRSRASVRMTATVLRSYARCR